MTKREPTEADFDALLTYEPDPDLVAILAGREPEIRSEPQAYKRAVIRMTLTHILNRHEALEELVRLSQEIDNED